MKLQLQTTELGDVTTLQNRIEDNSTKIDEIVDGIIQPYIKDLDRYVLFIRDCLQDGEKPPTTTELEDFCMNLSTYIYFAGGLCEHLGVRDDIAKSVYKEMYNSNRNSIQKGTVADKDSLAELQSQQEQIISICYTRAYKTVKVKVENAQEILQSCKKVLSHRMQEEELTRIGAH